MALTRTISPARTGRPRETPVAESRGRKGLAPPSETKPAATEEEKQEIPPFPDVLLETGRRWWMLYCQRLIDRGDRIEDYLIGLEHLCGVHDEIAAMTKEIDGNLMLKNSRGNSRSHPLVPEKTKLIILVRTMQNDFRLTPASSRVGTAGMGSPSQRKQVASRRRSADPFV